MVSVNHAMVTIFLQPNLYVIRVKESREFHTLKNFLVSNS